MLSNANVAELSTDNPPVVLGDGRAHTPDYTAKQFQLVRGRFRGRSCVVKWLNEAH